jgi:hypothetical protein
MMMMMLGDIENIIHLRKTISAGFLLFWRFLMLLSSFVSGMIDAMQPATSSY